MPRSTDIDLSGFPPFLCDGPMGKKERHAAGGGGGSFCPSPCFRHFHISYQFQPHRQKYAITAWIPLPIFSHSSRIIVVPGLGFPFTTHHTSGFCYFWMKNILLFMTAKCMELWASRSLRWHCIVRWAARALSSSSPFLPCAFSIKSFPGGF